MNRFAATISAVTLCVALAGCGKDGKDGANGKDGAPGKDGSTFRVVEKFEVAVCAPNETIASAMCFPADGAMLAVGVAPGFQTPSNAGGQNVLTATCPKLTVRLICTPK